MKTTFDTFSSSAARTLIDGILKLKIQGKRTTAMDIVAEFFSTLDR